MNQSLHEKTLCGGGQEMSQGDGGERRLASPGEARCRGLGPQEQTGRQGLEGV